MRLTDDDTPDKIKLNYADDNVLKALCGYPSRRIVKDLTSTQVACLRGAAIFQLSTLLEMDIRTHQSRPRTVIRTKKRCDLAATY